MRTRGMKSLDPVLETKQVDWMFVRVEDCPNEQAERQLVAKHFRLPRQPLGNLRAFVEPVVVQRSRRRVLFQQVSGEVY